MSLWRIICVAHEHTGAREIRTLKLFCYALFLQPKFIFISFDHPWLVSASFPLVVRLKDGWENNMFLIGGCNSYAERFDDVSFERQ